MPVLSNAKHERFAQALAKGNTLLVSHEIAGYSPNIGNAGTLSRKPEIKARLTEIKQAGARRAEVSVQSIIDELEEARDLAKEVKQPSSLVSASMGKAKVAGLLVDKQEVTGANGEPLLTGELALARWIAEKLAEGEAKLIEGEAVEHQARDDTTKDD